VDDRRQKSGGIMNREETITRAFETARSNDHYSGCSQAVLGAVQETLGIGNAESFRAATVLSGGVARRGETCGALLGALMALGVAIGRDDMTDTAAYGRATDAAQPVIDAFKERVQAAFGLTEPMASTLCRDIQARIFGRSFVMYDKADLQEFLAAGGHDPDKCPQVCAIAAGLATEAILDSKK
jgi:C_GCAxxG_C_C family probable redox protein